MVALEDAAIESELFCSDPQSVVLSTDRPVIFFGGGVGSGKTKIGTEWLIMRSAEMPAPCYGLIGANSYPQLYDSTIRSVIESLDEWNWPHRPRKLPRGYSPMTLEVWNGERFVEWLCRSMDTSISGLNTAAIWLDEVWDTDKDVYDVLSARNRDKRMALRGVPGSEMNPELLTTTLDSKDSWMYELFVEKVDQGGIWADSVEVVYTTTYDNQHNLSPGYLTKLEASYDQHTFRRMVLSEWVGEFSTIYHEFDRRIHVDEAAEFDETLPTFWSHDFNISTGKPMSSILFQEKRGAFNGRVRKEIHVFDEIVLDTADTNDAIDEWVERYSARIDYQAVTICGDAAGRARDTRSKTSDYGLLRDAGFTQQDVPLSNPPVRTRHNRVNAMLRSANGDVRVRIHPRCKTLVKGLETVRLKDGARYIELETREQHVTTPLGYAICARFPDETRRMTTAPPMVRTK